MEDLKRFVPNVHFELIPIKNLVSNQDYQRNLSQMHIDRAVENFDLCQINPVKVSRRDGINYVFNGQHTIEIIAQKSGSRETPVWCMIYDDLNYEQEADIFANQQKYVKSLVPMEVFKANIEAGNEEQITILKLVRSYGLEISATHAPGNICAVSALESIYRKHGIHVLDRVLRLCIATWEGDTNSFSANMLNGLTKIVTTYDGLLDEMVFKHKLGAVSIRQIARTAKERRAGSLGYAEAMVLEYNGRKQTSKFRLPLHMLYTGGKSARAKLNLEDEETDPEEYFLQEGEDVDVPETADDDSDTDPSDDMFSLSIFDQAINA